MLAMDVNDDAGCLTPRGDLGSIASMLAPTGVPSVQVIIKPQHFSPFIAVYQLSPLPKRQFPRPVL
jgi:hypothetical protein